GNAGLGLSAGWGWRRGADVRLEPLHQLWLGHEADDALDSLAVREQDHRRDARDAEVHRRVLVLVDVELDDPQLAGLLSGDLLQNGSDHAARAAPLRPEVDEHGRLAARL